MHIFHEDDGVGVPESDEQKILERGFGKNAGLGLFLTKAILAATMNSLREVGTPGKGARFEMLVPENAYRFGQT